MNLASIEADRPRHVLVVDDDSDGREIMAIVLTYDGFLTTTAGSGEEALAVVAQQRPDLILVDVRMPGMNGYDFAATIKGNAATRDIPIIMMSALSDREARAPCMEAGAADYLAKPMDRAEIVSRVGRALGIKT
jgi:CheY-like chemotaxis protein